MTIVRIQLLQTPQSSRRIIRTPFRKERRLPLQPESKQLLGRQGIEADIAANESGIVQQTSMDIRENRIVQRIFRFGVARNSGLAALPLSEKSCAISRGISVFRNIAQDGIVELHGLLKIFISPVHQRHAMSGRNTQRGTLQQSLKSTLSRRVTKATHER